MSIAAATGLCFGEVRGVAPEAGAVDQPLDLRPLIEVDNACDIDRIRLFDVDSGQEVRTRVDDERQAQEVVPLQPLLPDHAYEVRVDLLLGQDRVIGFRTGTAEGQPVGRVDVEVSATVEDCFVLDDGSQSAVWVLDGEVLQRTPGTLVGLPSRWLLAPDDALRSTVFVNPAVENDPLCMEVWRRSPSGERAFDEVCVPAPALDPAVCQGVAPPAVVEPPGCACGSAKPAWPMGLLSRRRRVVRAR